MTVETFGDANATIDQIFKDILDFGLQIKKYVQTRDLHSQSFRITKESEEKKEEQGDQTQYWNPWVVEDIDEAETKEEVVEEVRNLFCQFLTLN